MLCVVGSFGLCYVSKIFWDYVKCCMLMWIVLSLVSSVCCMFLWIVLFVVGSCGLPFVL